jgi:hypothetical protein
MDQRIFWSRRRNWQRKKVRPRKIEFNEAKQIFEPVELEEDVVKKIIALLWYSGIPVFRERERVPSCQSCGKFVAAPSEPGHPDLHGFIPARKIFTSNVRSLGSVAFYIECKRPSGGISTEVQKEFVKRARRDGCLAFFATCWQDVWWNFWGIGIELPEG